MRVTIFLIAITVIVFILQIVFGLYIISFFSLTPALVWGGFYWQFFTYMFLHGSVTHLMFTMFPLATVGFAVEKRLGWKKYLFLYVISGIVSALFYVLLMDRSHILTVGASGAVFGVLTACIFLFHKNRLFSNIPLPAVMVVVIVAIIEIFFNTVVLEISLVKRLGGIVTGVALTTYWLKQETSKSSRFERK